MAYKIIYLALSILTIILCFSCNNDNSNPVVEIVSTSKTKILLGDTVNVSVITSYGNHLFAGTNNGYIYFSGDNGSSWHLANNGIALSNIKCISIIGLKVFVGTIYKGVYISNDYGSSFTQMNTGLTNKDIWAFAVSDSNIFAGSDKAGVFLTTNNGENWKPVNTGLTSKVIWSLAAIGSDIYAGNGDGIYKSTNSGQSWEATEIRNAYVYSIVINYPYVFASTDLGLSISSDKGKSWKSSYTIGRPVLTKNNTKIYALSYKLYESSDNGVSWNQVDSTEQNMNANCITANSTNIFVGTANGVIWRYQF